MMATDRDDKQQIGLTADANEAILRIADSYFGGSQMDAYRFAAAYAVGASLDLDEAPQTGYVTKFHGAAVMSSGLLETLQILEIGDASRPNATAERLAELGVRDLSRRLDGNESMADILSEVAGSD